MGVLGQVLRLAAPRDAAGVGRYRFQIAIPADYVVIDAAQNLATGPLDGATVGGGSRWLDPGTHELVSPTPGKLIVIWARARQQGYRWQAATSP